MRRSDILSGLQAARQQDAFGVVAGVQSISVTFYSPDSDRHGSIVIALEVRVVEIDGVVAVLDRSEEHTSALQSLMRISYAVFCLTKKKETQDCTTQQNKQL